MDNTLTPISPKLLERQIPTNNPTIATIGDVQPRHILACFGSLNKPGERRYKITIPYHPADNKHDEHIQEILNHDSSSQLLLPNAPISLTYYGEGNK